MAADNPGLFDKINMDKAVEMALESVGVPSVILRTDEEMQQRREEAKPSKLGLSTPQKFIKSSSTILPSSPENTL
jgi:hypothetical protein